MDQRALASDLNALLAAENASLARHLGEATPYVNAQTFRVWRHMQKVQHDSVLHSARLVKLIRDIGAEVRPLPFDQSVADLHYLDIPSLIPHLIAEKKRQADVYRQALGHAAGNTVAVSELSELLGECNAHLSELEASGVKLGAATA
jgi:hypothetical protein